MKKKVSELSNAELDCLVAKAEGFKYVGVIDTQICVSSDYPLNELCDRQAHYFSTYWAQGGPIIEREGIRIEPGKDMDFWIGAIDQSQWSAVVEYGKTPLIAAMRCYVVSKFGREVEV